MQYFKLVLVLLTCLSWSSCQRNDYCSICPDHTMCKYHGVGSACVGPNTFGVTEKEKKEIVDVHNHYRSFVAAGKEKRGKEYRQPKASNMLKLFYDEKLAEVAQRWADQCNFAHDKCRNDARWQVGQNIYFIQEFGTHIVNWTEAITAWYNEVTLFNPLKVRNFELETATGHYTQMLWHNTYLVGCGRRGYGKNNIYVCNYGPTGNWDKQEMYKIGEPCTNCPAGSTCENYLCVLPKAGKGNPNKPSKVTPINPPTKPSPPISKNPTTSKGNSANEVLKPTPGKNHIVMTKEQYEEFLKKFSHLLSGLRVKKQ